MNNFPPEESPFIREQNSNTGQNLALKIIQDVNFLKDRIDRVKRLHTPNSSVLRTYESMLSTRLAVLDWMRDNGQLEELDEHIKTKINHSY
ncbi:MAG: hypothetical protein RL497_694 [Pseudomonadota bacterium]|jgi:hypothetical protein